MRVCGQVDVAYWLCIQNEFLDVDETQYGQTVKWIADGYVGVYSAGQCIVIILGDLGDVFQSEIFDQYHERRPHAFFIAAGYTHLLSRLVRGELFTIGIKFS